LANPPTTAKRGDRVHLCSRSHWKDVLEKLLRFEALIPVLKLTQVGETSSLRRSGEHWLRNSAKWPRKFAIRGAPEGSRFWGSQ
jgi:hypothetical protein